MGIAMVAVQPQGITDDGERLVGVFLLRGEDAAEDGLNAERGKDAGGETSGVDFLWSLRRRRARSWWSDEAAKGGKASRCARVVPISRAVTGVFRPVPR